MKGKGREEMGKEGNEVEVVGCGGGALEDKRAEKAREVGRSERS